MPGGGRKPEAGSSGEIAAARPLFANTAAQQYEAGSTPASQLDERA